MGVADDNRGRCRLVRPVEHALQLKVAAWKSDRFLVHDASQSLGSMPDRFLADDIVLPKEAPVIIHPRDIEETKQEPRPLVLKRLVNIDEHSGRISLTWVRIWGHHDRVVNDGSDRVYYIVSGSGRFQVGEDEPEDVAEGDIVFIPAGTGYELDGEMTYLVMNGPAFATGSDRVLPAQMS